MILAEALARVYALAVEEVGNSVSAERPVGYVYVNAVLLADLVKITLVILSRLLSENRLTLTRYEFSVMSVGVTDNKDAFLRLPLSKLLTRPSGLARRNPRRQKPRS